MRARVVLAALLAALGVLASGCGGAGLARFEDSGIAFRPEDFPPRPARLNFEGVEPLEFECVGRSHPFFFSVGGRSFQAFVSLGDDAGPKLREQALAVLESIRVEGP